MSALPALAARSLTGGVLSRFLYTHNPFYLVSALLVLVGLHEALAEDRSLTGGWLLMGMLCGYTLLLAVAGCAIVRCGQVWEDARMILLVIVLLFLALSASFDRIALEDPGVGARFLTLGMAFAALVSEGVLRYLAIRLSARYRLPFYLALALLFSYPVALGQFSVDGRNVTMSWGVFLFPAFASGVLLTLWPASRSPKEDEPPSGAAWTWPCYPWSLFAALWIAIALRAYSLSMAFEACDGSGASFRPYFLIPLVLAGAVLLLEMGVAKGRRAMQSAAVIAATAVLALSFPGWRVDPLAARFLRMLCQSVGSPLQLALVGLGLFYALAWRRGLVGGEAGLVACAALASFTDRQTVDFETFTSAQPLPLAIVAAWQLALVLRRRSFARTLVGTTAGIVAIRASGAPLGLPAPPGYVLWHASALALLLLAALYDDRWARRICRIATPLIPIAAFVSATSYEFMFPLIPRGYHAVYLAGLSAIAALCWRKGMEMRQLLAALATVGCLMLFGARSAYLTLQASPLSEGLPWIAGGLTIFVLAVLVSCGKGGLLARGWSSLNSLNKASLNKASLEKA